MNITPEQGAAFEVAMMHADTAAKLGTAASGAPSAASRALSDLSNRFSDAANKFLDIATTEPEAPVQAPTNPDAISLQQYLQNGLDRGLIDHSLRVTSANVDGRPKFYIHPDGADGDTLEFEVYDNVLVPTAGLHL